MQYFKKEGDKLVCLLCNHYCKIKEGHTGICGVNKNTGDKIECLVYGYPAAMHIDPIEKKPLYHFLPGSRSFSLGTVGCNFRCPFCQNWSLSQEKKINTSRYIPPEEIVSAAKMSDCATIAYTYNEPTIFYPYAKDIALLAKEEGIKNVYVSNGFESSEVIDDMKGVIDGANIDLKSFDEKYYKKDLKGDLKKILENLKHFVKNGIWIEVTTLIVPTKNDSKEELNKIATFIADELGKNVPWHISAFHPDYKERNLPRTSFDSLKLAHDLGKKAGLNYVYIGNIGYENPTICPKCGKEILDRRYFDVLLDKVKDGKCVYCGEKIAGVF
jgi:pyruvate formate lyase activating enzyme